MRPRAIAGAISASVVMSLGLVVTAASPAHAALGGPVIIGGDDLNDHGFNDGTNNQEGWLYIEKALGNIKAKVTKSNDGTVAVLGSADSTATSSDGGGAAHYTVPKVGLTPVYVNTQSSIDGYLKGVASGAKKPAILYVTGNDAGNDLGDDPSGGDEGKALADNATTISDFVNAGGGLLSHGTEYRWLFGLLPKATAVDSGSSGDLYKTAAGNNQFPGVSEADFNAGPWHNHFEGDFGGLDVLVRSHDVQDTKGNDAAVILGGASAQLPGSITLTPPSATNPIRTSHTVTATVRNGQGNVVSGATVSFSVTAGPNKGKTGSSVTNASGQATFTYTDAAGPGTDTIEAAFTDENGIRRSTTASKTWQAPSNSPTSCKVTAVRAGPPAQQDVTVKDADGVQSITNVHVINGTVSVPSFTRGTKNAIVLTATKSDQSKRTFWEFDVTDSAGKTTHCV